MSSGSTFSGVTDSRTTSMTASSSDRVATLETISPPENLVNQLGYQSLFAGKNEEAIAIFKSNVERYPNSANVYDSLAEAYEKSERIDLAAPLYEKAQTLGEQNSDPNLAIYKTNFQRASEKLKQAEAAKKTQD